MASPLLPTSSSPPLPAPASACLPVAPCPPTARGIRAGGDARRARSSHRRRLCGESYAPCTRFVGVRLCGCACVWVRGRCMCVACVCHAGPLCGPRQYVRWCCVVCQVPCMSLKDQNRCGPWRQASSFIIQASLLVSCVARGVGLDAAAGPCCCPWAPRLIDAAEAVRAVLKGLRHREGTASCRVGLQSMGDKHQPSAALDVLPATHMGSRPGGACDPPHGAHPRPHTGQRTPC